MDYISREAAIMFAKLLVHTAYEREAKIKDCEIEKAFNDIPAADVAPVRRGRWIRKIRHIPEDDYKQVFFVCSECGQTRMLSFHNFCPNCGADMREEQT